MRGNVSGSGNRMDLYRPGLWHVGSYQSSGIPYASASILCPSGADVGKVDGNYGVPVEVNFPTITKFVTVVNEQTGANRPLRVGFSSNGVMGSAGSTPEENFYFILDNGESYTAEWKLSKLFLIGQGAGTTASVIAGLTGISTQTLTANPGPNDWSGSSGVG